MRQLKFRAWLSNAKKMDYQPTIIYDLGTKCYKSLVRDSVLMQYTGLKDKVGREIWEGDIVYIKAYKEEHKAIVLFKDGMFGIEWKDYTTTSAMLKVVGWFDSIIRLGNKYENPELLEELNNENS